MSALRLALLSLALLVLAAGAAAAQPADAGFHASARVGMTAFETPTVRDREGAGLLGYDRRGTTWSVSAGHEWRVARFLFIGIEVGYTDNGQATITYASANAYAFRSTQVDVLASATVAAGKFRVGLKAGIGRTREQYRISTYISGTPDLNSERARDLPVAALTLGYAVTKRLSVFVDARRTFGDVADTVTKALIASNPTPPPYRDVLNSVSRVTAFSAGVKIRI